MNILFDLASEYISNHSNFEGEIYLNFLHDATQYDPIYTAVGVGEFDWSNYRRTIAHRGKGLMITINEPRLNILSVLNVLASAMENYDRIEKDQYTWIRDKRETINGIHQYDTLITIHPVEIEKFKSKSHPVIDSLVSNRYFACKRGRKYSWGSEWYFSSNKYHFYRAENFESEMDDSLKINLRATVIHDEILVLDELSEVVSDRFGHFIFTNASTFYFMPRLEDTVSGPFKLTGVIPGRVPVHKYSVEYISNDQGIHDETRIFMNFDNFGQHTKAVFIPEKSILISNYQDIESDFIHGNKEKDPNNLWKYLAVAIGAVFIGMIIGRLNLKRDS